MRQWLNFSIRTKLMLLISLALVAGQLFTGAIAAWQEASRYATQKRDALVSAAQVLAAAAAQPVAAHDQGAARVAIRAAARMPGVSYVAIWDAQKKFVAEAGSAAQLESDLTITDPNVTPAVSDVLQSQAIDYAAPLVLGGETVGTIRVVSETGDLTGRLLEALSVTALGALVGLLLAAVLALRLQSAITGPLRQLTSLMRGIGKSHDYAVKMPVTSRDEVGILATGFNAMIDDIHLRDQRIARHMETLEHEVAERTRDYRRAAAEADSANQAKSDFLATMSHEIRTPMNGILVMAELLAACELPQKARRHAAVITNAGQSLLAIINDILDFSKIEAGRLDVEQLELDPVSASENVLRLFAGRAQSKGLDLAAQIETPEGALIVADPVRLGQVLGNLVNNALKFTQQGSVVLKVGLSEGRVKFAVSDTGIGIAADKLDTIFESFSQADQTTTRRFGGTGLGLTIARKLVTAMGGALKVTSEVGVGSTFFFDLPLAHFPQPDRLGREAGTRGPALICLAGSASADAAFCYLAQAGYEPLIVSAESLAEHSADAALVLADSGILTGEITLPAGLPRLAVAPDGQNFDDQLASKSLTGVLTLPLTRADILELPGLLQSGQQLPSRQSEADTQSLPQFTGYRVLVADDSLVNREVAQQALLRLGATPVLVENGRQALQSVYDDSIDLVLMDGSMPEMDGFEATRHIRAREKAEHLPRLPIIALTAHVVGAGSDAWQKADMDGIVHKPYSLAKLADCLSTHLDGKIPAAKREDSKPEMPESALLNAKALDDLREMSGGNEELIARITRLYTQQAPARITELHGALAAGDLNRLASIAHALKSMSLNIGAQAVGQLAAQIESRARIEQALPDQQALDRLQDMTEQTLDMLARRRA